MAEDLAQSLKATLIGQLETLRDGLKETVQPLTEDEFWQKPLDPGNSAGHLVLHLTGNLNHFVGAHLANSGYVRNRDREFTATNPPPKAVVLTQLDEAVATFRKVVGPLTPEQMMAPHPEARFGTVLNALATLLTHFAVHRGQVSYIVRLVRR